MIDQERNFSEFLVVHVLHPSNPVPDCSACTLMVMLEDPIPVQGSEPVRRKLAGIGIKCLLVFAKGKGEHSERDVGLPPYPIRMTSLVISTANVVKGNRDGLLKA